MKFVVAALSLVAACSSPHATAGDGGGGDTIDAPAMAAEATRSTRRR